MSTSGLGITTSGFAKIAYLESTSKIVSDRTISRVSAIKYVEIIHEKIFGHMTYSTNTELPQFSFETPQFRILICLWNVESGSEISKQSLQQF